VGAAKGKTMQRLILATGLLVYGTVLAETLPEILVSAGRTAEHSLDIPAAATIIGQEEIADSGARNLAELLRTVTGVHVSDGVGGGGSARIDMRGFGSTANSNVAIMINGRKINPATDSGSLYLNSIDLSNVAQIEIIEGSAGTLYGNQAVGGLINIITRRPDTRSRRTGVGAGSYNGWELSGGLTELIRDHVGLSLQVHRRDSDNYRERNVSRMERLDARLEIGHHTGYSYIDALVLQDYVQTPGALLAPELARDREQAVFDGDYLDTDSRVLRLGTSRMLDEHWRLEAELALRDDDRDFVQSFRAFAGTRSTQDRDSVELTPRLIGRFEDTTVTLGMDFLSTDYELVTAFGPQGDEQDIVALYGQVNHPLAANLSVTVGLRHAQVNDDIDNGGMTIELGDSVTVGSLGFSYRPDPAWRLFVRADQNYRFAKVDEHTNIIFGQPVGLDTQHGTSYETGAEYAAGGISLTARAYHLRLKDEISFDATTFSNVNLSRSRRNGVALSLDGDVSRDIRLGAGYEYLDSEITSGTHDGSDVPLVPEHKANLYVEYRPSLEWLARLDLEYVDEQYLGSDYDNASEPLDDHTVANLVIHRELGDWRLSARVNNLFDEEYSETGATSFAGDGFNPAPERNFWFGASYRLED
jgi:iron complex outermembrane receptor protein